VDTFLDLLDSAPRGSTALFYYAGHGVQSKDDMYLFPNDISFPLRHPDELKIGAVFVDDLVKELNSTSTAMRMLFLDACRTDIEPILTRNLSLAVSATNIVQAKSDTLIVYSTSEGQLALDGTPLSETPYSPFAEGAIKLFRSGDDVTVGVQQLMGEVRRLTRQSQVPVVMSTVSSRFQFIKGGVQSSQDAALEAEKAAWNTVRETGYSRVQLSHYLQNFPGGLYEAEAKTYLEAISQGPLQQTPSSPVPTSVNLSQSPTARSELTNFGLSVDLSPDKGWVISSVDPATPFSGRIRAGDEIWKINGETITSASQAPDMIYKSMANDGRVGLVVRRFGQPYSVTIR
jgi:hypothetical protein